jgi:site-specific recombinase XerD
MLGLPRLLEAAGCRVPLHPWHALRHTFASHYIMQGGNILVLQKILGHTDVKITAIYAHLAPEFLGAEMNRIQFKQQDKPPEA